ncbi:MAG: divalent-cation tolerance protein CutA [Candidatus Omnitrophica bacterium]|nr:divalent-cation tolerance protein CutA [Candidatus Omnitrophota bacterium]MDD5429240.1 divalent-cation tolerance protein CutA [Candidatus Omnitrophota bacterium]
MALVVLVTIPQNKAERLAKVLLKAKMCACVNIIKGVDSLFRWHGAVNSEKEAVLVIKTRKSLFLSLSACIKKHHPYSVPEIIAFAIDRIDKAYYEWLKKSCSLSGKRKGKDA